MKNECLILHTLSPDGQDLISVYCTLLFSPPGNRAGGTAEAQAIFVGLVSKRMNEFMLGRDLLMLPILVGDVRFLEPPFCPTAKISSPNAFHCAQRSRGWGGGCYLSPPRPWPLQLGCYDVHASALLTPTPPYRDSPCWWEGGGLRLLPWKRLLEPGREGRGVEEGC